MKYFVIGLLVSIITQAIYHYVNPYRRIYCNDDGWILISAPPSKKVDYGNTILLTDGKTVRECSTLSYNKDGKILLRSYGEELATHWRIFPLPPMN
jgi:hypothetical protein